LTTAQTPTEQAVLDALNDETKGSVYGSGPGDIHPFYHDNSATWERLRAVIDEMRTTQQRRKHLPTAPFERKHHYTFRAKAVEFVPQSPLQIDRVIGSIYGNNPTVESDDEELQGFIEDCDGHGTHLLEYAEGMSRDALGMGSRFYSVLPPELTKEQFDVLTSDEVRNGSEAVQVAAREATGVDINRPLIRCWSREQVRNWSLKPMGLRWAQIVEDVTVQLEPDKPQEHYEQRTTFTESGLIVERRKKGARGSGDQTTDSKFERVEELSVEHPHDFAPLKELQGLSGKAFQGRSMIERSSRADINAYNEESWAALSRYRHANAQTWLKSNRTWKNVRTDEALILRPEEEVGILETTGAASEQFEQVIERHRRAAVTQTGADPNTTPDAPDGELSGIAYRVRLSNTEKRVVEQHQRCVVATIKSILEMAQSVMGREVQEDQIRVELLSSFEMLDPAQHANLVQTATPMIPSPTFERESAKQLASMVVRKRDHELIEKIHQEIEANPTPTEKQEAMFEEEMRAQEEDAADPTK